MKIRLLALAALAAAALTAGAQRLMTPPHVLIVPDMPYCSANGYIQDAPDGSGRTVADYERALAEDGTLHSALTQVAQLINERNSDIVIVDLSQAIELARNDAALAAANGAVETAEERIIRNSNADILVKVNYDLLRTGPVSRINYTLRATDAYTGRNFAPLEGLGPEATASNPAVLLREAIYGGMDSFLNRILAYYNGMREHGRMVAFDITVAAGSARTMGSRVGDVSLREFIEDYLYDHSVDGSGLERVRGGEAFLHYDGVYIPLTTTVRGRQRRQGAKDVAQGLVAALADAGVAADFSIVGLGRANISIR